MAGGERAEMRNGLGWCLPNEDTAGGKRREKKISAWHMWTPLDNFLNFYEVTQLVFGQHVLLKGSFGQK